MECDEEDYLIFEENYEYNPDAYKYGDIDGKRIRVSVDDWMDIWSWKTYKTKEDCWFKLKPYIHQMKPNGYKKYILYVNRIPYPMSRVLFKMYNECWDITDTSDTNLIDHINRNSLDNRIENLRVLTAQQNQWNTGARGTNQLASGKWRASIMFNGKTKTKEPFDTEPEAHEQYLLWKAEFHVIKE